jgi:hypothetical protein
MGKFVSGRGSKKQSQLAEAQRSVTIYLSEDYESVTYPPAWSQLLHHWTFSARGRLTPLVRHSTFNSELVLED